MTGDQIEQVCTALYDGLYALEEGYGVSREEAVESLRQAIWTINDETGVDTGNRLLAEDDAGWRET